MATTDWAHYQVQLSQPQPAKAAVPAAKVVARQLASRGERLMAAAFDGILFMLPIGAAFLIRPASAGDAQISGTRATIWILGLLAVTCCQMFLLSRGQSLGKLIVGVRIVDYDTEENPGFMRLYVWRVLVPALLSLVPFFGQIFALVNVLFIFGEQRRCLHDCIAGTKVVACS
jgi:uncharacterized RDD family membrane protein YckC